MMTTSTYTNGMASDTIIPTKPDIFKRNFITTTFLSITVMHTEYKMAQNLTEHLRRWRTDELRRSFDGVEAENVIMVTETELSEGVEQRLDRKPYLI
ncbi:unnamed protein product [Vicia faba]|uniref:Uncharacterized protein n=1 Tax=Vicia faba TaxID=3906 RepID=A0AAV1B1B1_VICFA|nr:unnamed protein product [Vicia faba]